MPSRTSLWACDRALIRAGGGDGGVGGWKTQLLDVAVVVPLLLLATAGLPAAGWSDARNARAGFAVAVAATAFVIAKGASATWGLDPRGADSVRDVDVDRVRCVALMLRAASYCCSC